MSRPPSTRGARKPPAERSAEITDAARALALESGLAAVTLRALAQRVGVTSALIAHYEPSMDALVARTFGDIVAGELAEIVALTGALTPRERLKLLVQTVSDGSRTDVTVVWVDAWALGRRNEQLAASVREQMDAWQGVLQATFTAGARAGDFSAADPAQLAWLVLGLIDGLNAQSLVRWGGASDRGDLVARTIAVLVGLPADALS
ncbi:TetR/AcrR family transcriptional regulator [Microterricola pindariensis]|uniref:TetR family transcriptional regulator n=1 Tax=Microterricola pindariensis TaxID=478010 RepID=A0ABX5AWT2_9MICO|nr:TetR/AcrR family transcriptional regulator [Microterricola pindariensis]PPL19300.1 TetR family transcriptional regulator [Microterricola pindariensis]